MVVLVVLVVFDRKRGGFRLTKPHFSINILHRMINIGMQIRPDVGIISRIQCPIRLINLELPGTKIFSFFQLFDNFGEPKLPPKSPNIKKNSLQKSTSILKTFFLSLFCLFEPSRPRKAWFYLRKTTIFRKSRFSEILQTIVDVGSMFDPQNL